MAKCISARAMLGALNLLKLGTVLKNKSYKIGRFFPNESSREKIDNTSKNCINGSFLNMIKPIIPSPKTRIPMYGGESSDSFCPQYVETCMGWFCDSSPLYSILPNP